MVVKAKINPREQFNKVPPRDNMVIPIWQGCEDDHFDVWVTKQQPSHVLSTDATCIVVLYLFQIWEVSEKGVKFIWGEHNTTEIGISQIRILSHLLLVPG